jgi:hypothetical protein
MIWPFTRWKIDGKPQPPWVAPRPVSDWSEREWYLELYTRLERVREVPSGFIWRDRETGQLWEAFEVEASPAPPYGLRPIDHLPPCPVRP